VECAKPNEAEGGQKGGHLGLASRSGVIAYATAMHELATALGYGPRGADHGWRWGLRGNSEMMSASRRLGDRRLHQADASLCVRATGERLLSVILPGF
jgi:hypothetical protein